VGEVEETVIDELKRKLMELHKADKEIARAHVQLKHSPGSFNGQYVCEVDLTIFGSSIMVAAGGSNYLSASRKVLDEVTRQVQEQIRRQNDPPDIMVSTVKV
jgi:ribosome-associated translation inhibitor RaiA